MLTWTVWLSLLVLHTSYCSMLKPRQRRENHFHEIRKRETLPNCTDEKFLQVLTHFRIANPEDLFLLAMKEGKETRFCRDLTVGADKVGQYLKHCTPTSSMELYLKLISGLIALKRTLCDDSDFKELFKRNAECYNLARYETEPCWGPQDWLESDNSTTVCKVMKEIQGCYYTKTFLNCGLFAAEILNNLMKTVMNSVTSDFCPNIVQDNYVRDLRSLSLSKSSSMKPPVMLMTFCYLMSLVKR